MASYPQLLRLMLKVERFGLNKGSAGRAPLARRMLVWNAIVSAGQAPRDVGPHRVKPMQDPER
ncbi:hypothetical protein SPHV1_230045 [Novosphingobium sp. KN65.2]|nr:hypothetical protein SPHV1_230045 [Novosphingobium sp. KN65.2]